MTSGSSQGLFVIVAVIIFGIFVVISYMLFRDKLQTGLANIFDDSIVESEESLVPFSPVNLLLNNNYTIINKLDMNSYDLELNFKNNATNYWGDTTPIGFNMNNVITIPYNYKIIVEYEIYSPIDTKVNVDLNGYPVGDFFMDSSINDIYGDSSKQNSRSDVKANTWTKVNYWFVNNNDNNTKKQSIMDNTLTGIIYKDAVSLKNSGQKFKVRNIQYKVVKL